MTFDEVIKKFINPVETDKADGTSITYKKKYICFRNMLI